MDYLLRTERRRGSHSEGSKRLKNRRPAKRIQAVFKGKYKYMDSSLRSE
jgi:hypothetical protein